MNSTRSRRKRRARNVLVHAVAAMALVACSPDGARYQDVAGLGRALRDAGVSCEPAGISSSRLASQVASCAAGDISLFVFDSTAARDRWLRFGPTFAPTAVGRNWAVQTDDGGLIAKVAASLRAEKR